MTNRETMELALEALMNPEYRKKVNDAIFALRMTLAAEKEKQEKQKPVAWLNSKPLYAAPPNIEAMLRDAVRDAVRDYKRDAERVRVDLNVALDYISAATSAIKAAQREGMEKWT